MVISFTNSIINCMLIQFWSSHSIALRNNQEKKEKVQ